VRCGPAGVRGVGGAIRVGSGGAMSKRMTQGYCGAAFMALAVTGLLNVTLRPGQGPFSRIHILARPVAATKSEGLNPKS